MIKRMRSAAEYVISRNVQSLEFSGGWFSVSTRLVSDATEEEKRLERRELLHSGDYVIAADVLVYNRNEILQKLTRTNHGTYLSDAAIVLEAYITWGEDCVNYIYGDFAFAIVNMRKGTIFCARDPLGVRPFFYSLHHNCFVFASELRYVYESFLNRPGIDQDYLFDTLVTVKSFKDRTPFKTIYRLLPGHTLSYDKGGINLNSFWHPDPENGLNLRHEEDYVRLFRDKLVNAVNMRCRNANAVGSELSGGLDSSAVTGIAANYAGLNRIPFHAFSNIFPEDSGIDFADEREFISQMLEFNPMKWSGIDRLNYTIPELLQMAIDIQGCFAQQNFCIFNRGIYEMAGNNGIDVLLSGFGGDEMVSARIAMPWNEIIGRRNWNILAEELFHKGFSGRALLKAGKVLAKYLYSRIYQPAYKKGVFTTDLLDRRFANLSLQYDFSKRHELKNRYVEKYKIPVRGSVSTQQLEKVLQDHLPQRLEYCYAASAQYGLEYRYPLLDVNLIETCLAFPPWLKQHRGVNRFLFREAIKGFVPEGIRKRDDKTSATIPHTFYSLKHERDDILNLIHESSSSEYLNTIFDFNRFSAWYEKLVKRDPDDMNYLMPGAFYQYLMIMLYYK